MASRLVVEKVPLKVLQKHHHNCLNNFNDQETLVDAISNRPGFFGPNPVAFLSLFTRRTSLQWGDLEEALINDRTLIRAPAFRGSLFLLNAQDYPIFFRTFGSGLMQRGMQKLLTEKISKNHLYHYADLLEAADPQMPLSVSDLTEIIFPGRATRPSADICKCIIQKLCDMGILVRTSAKGWKGNDFNYALMKTWVPDLCLKPDNPETARTETIRKYLRAYGPVSMEDVSWWTGLPILQCQRSVSHLRREVLRFHVEGYRDDMIGLKETVELLRRKDDVNDDIQLLPPWDPYTLGFRCRKRIADKEVMPFIYDGFGNATSVIVDSGKVIGVWQFRDADINVLEFHIFPAYRERKRAAMPKIEEWAKCLSQLSKAAASNIVERPLEIPLTERPASSFLWPLGKFGANQSVGTKEPISPMERRTSNTFRQKYLDNQYLVRPNITPVEQEDAEATGLN